MDDPIRNDLLKSSDRLKQEVNKEQTSLLVQVLTYCVECHRIVYFSKDDIFEGRCLGVATNEIKCPFCGINIIVSKL
mgnify:FL=1